MEGFKAPALVLASALALGGCSTQGTLGERTMAAVPGCVNHKTSSVVQADGGDTVFINAATADSKGSGIPPEAAVCILRALEIPDSVLSHIGETRALDGQQTDSWADVKARWTYSGMEGLRITLTSSD